MNRPSLSVTPEGPNAPGPGFVAPDLEEVLDWSPIAMCLATLDDGIIRANYGAAELTGHPLSELMGRRPIDTFVHPDDVPSVLWVRDRVGDGERVEVRHRLLTADGELRHVRGSITPIFGEDNEVRYAVLQYVDETELVIASRELDHQREMLARFAEVVAHDLRTPLTGIVGYSEILRKELEEPSPEQAEILDLITASSMAAAGLIERTLDRALADEHDLAATVDLTELVDRVATLLGPALAAAKGRIQHTGSVRFLHTDERALEEVLLNLCQNSIKYRADRPLVINIEVDPTVDELVVVDNGKGIPEADLDRVFDRGHRVDQDGDGHGLGLARVQAIVESLGGTVVAERNQPEGTAIRLTLPGAFVHGDSADRDA
jgi:PAS domain S-box-containing protein